MAEAARGAELNQRASFGLEFAQNRETERPLKARCRSTPRA